MSPPTALASAVIALLLTSMSAGEVVQPRDMNWGLLGPRLRESLCVDQVDTFLLTPLKVCFPLSLLANTRTQ